MWNYECYEAFKHEEETGRAKCWKSCSEQTNHSLCDVRDLDMKLESFGGGGQTPLQGYDADLLQKHESS